MSNVPWYWTTGRRDQGVAHELGRQSDLVMGPAWLLASLQPCIHGKGF